MDLAEEDKKRREGEMAKYNETLPPKRAPSAYILYGSSVRDKIRSENPNASITEVAKIIGQRWKGLSENEKEVWTLQIEVQG